MSSEDARLVAALRNALKENARLREELDGTAASEPIAIVGTSCRLPGGVDTPEGLWEMVSEGREAVGPLPEDRGWDLESLLGRGDGPSTVMTQGSFLDSAFDFDPEFFGISPREAEAMEPQQRLLLETAWESLERAGIAPTSLAGTDTGVYVGAIPQEYGPPVSQAPDDGFAMTGVGTSIASGRLSYTLGLTGPALSLDTACSSSLVAVHLAVQALRAGECSLALAGGVTVMVSPSVLIEFTHMRGLSPSGRCKAFSADADGVALSEGAGMVVLEKLSDARRNGHQVLGLVRGGAVNQDGASNGLTAPNGPSQIQVIRRALADAGVSPEEIDLLEAHGTGTTLGDPIEAQAVLATYGERRPEGRPLWMGSLKSNVGHSQAAAGVLGLIKLTEAMRHGVMPPTLHADEPSRHVDWDDTVRLLREARPWPEAGGPRRAAVSSFGMSGTNAHLVIEAPPREEGRADRTAPREEEAPLLWTLSARTDAALRDQASRLASWLADKHEASVSEIGWSLVGSRARFANRAAVLASDREEARTALEAFADGRPAPGVLRGRAVPEPRTAFVFPGQGALGERLDLSDLLEAEPVFAEGVGACAEALSPYLDWSVTDALRGGEGAPDLARPDVAQPLLFTVMVSLARLWRSRGVEPSAVVGHSQGEIAAAHVAGILTLEDAAKVVALRSRLVLPLVGEGGMLALQLRPGQELPSLEPWAGRLDVAARNGPSTVVVSGAAPALAELTERCAQEGIFAFPVAADFAAHSPQVEPLREDLLAALEGIRPGPGGIPLHSTVEGARIDGTAMDADYWYRNIRDTVLFETAVRTMAEEDLGVFIEVGPRPVLTVGVQQTVEAALGAGAAAVLGSFHGEAQGPGEFLAALAEAHVCGVEPDWTSVYGPRTARGVTLPTYPFQRQRYRASFARDGASVGVDDRPAPGQAQPAAAPPGASGTDRAQALSDLVREQVAAVLGIADPEAVDMRRGFVEMGGTSLGAVRLRNALNAATGLELPVTVTFDHPTPMDLARHLEELHASAGPATDPLSALSRLREALAAGSADGEERARVARGLAELLEELGTEGRSAAPGTEGRDLEGKKDDELFELISKEFGIS